MLVAKCPPCFSKAFKAGWQIDDLEKPWTTATISTPGWTRNHYIPEVIAAWCKTEFLPHKPTLLQPWSWTFCPTAKLCEMWWTSPSRTQGRYWTSKALRHWQCIQAHATTLYTCVWTSLYSYHFTPRAQSQDVQIISPGFHCLPDYCLDNCISVLRHSTSRSPFHTVCTCPLVAVCVPNGDAWMCSEIIHGQVKYMIYIGYLGWQLLYM